MLAFNGNIRPYAQCSVLEVLCWWMNMYHDITPRPECQIQMQMSTRHGNESETTPPSARSRQSSDLIVTHALKLKLTVTDSDAYIWLHTGRSRIFQVKPQTTICRGGIKPGWGALIDDTPSNCYIVIDHTSYLIVVEEFAVFKKIYNRLFGDEDGAAWVVSVSCPVL